MGDQGRILKLRKIGGSYGVILPRELLDGMGLKPGDQIQALPQGTCSLLLTPEGQDLPPRQFGKYKFEVPDNFNDLLPDEELEGLS